MSHLPARRFALLWLVATTALVAAGCATLGRPDAVTLSERDLAHHLARAFPLDRRLLEVIDVSVDTPRLRLLPERNRMAVEAAVSTRDRLFGSSWKATLAFDSALRWEASDQTLRLAQVRVNQFRVEGDEPGSSRQAAQRLAPLLAERMLDDLVLYRLPPERQQQLARQGVRPKSVAITGAGVEVRFEPVP